MARLTHPFQMRVEHEQLGHLVNQGAPMQTEQFVLRVYGDHLSGHWPSSGLYDSPPTLDAHIQPQPDGVLLTGTVRESFNDAMWQPGFLGLTVFMGLLAIFGIVTLVTGPAGGGVPPLVIGALAAPAFYLLWRGAKRRRRPYFESKIEDLEQGLRDALRTGGKSPSAP